MRGDHWRAESTRHMDMAEDLAETASTKEEWEAVQGMKRVGIVMWGIGGALDLHDRKYATKETTS